MISSVVTISYSDGLIELVLCLYRQWFLLKVSWKNIKNKNIILQSSIILSSGVFLEARLDVLILLQE